MGPSNNYTKNSSVMSNIVKVLTFYTEKMMYQQNYFKLKIILLIE